MLTKYKLGELVDVTRGMSLPGENYSESGELIRLTLGNFNYNGGGFKENTSKSDIYYIGEVKSEYILNKGDIITPLTEQTLGLLGSTAMIPESGKYIQSQDVALVTPDESKLNRLFCYYLVSSDVVKKQLSAAAQQTKIRHTSPDKIKDCTVWIPELKLQEKIGKTLYDIDQKISLNTRMNAELEAMAKQLYDYWFVQFDFPFDFAQGKPDENGKPYKSSGGKMVWNEKLKREIPEGWEVKEIGEIAEIVNGATPLTSDDTNYGNDIIWITPYDLSNQKNKFIVKGQRSISQKGYDSCSTTLLPKGSVLMSSRAPIGLLAIANTELCTNQGFKSFVPNDMEDTYYLYYYLQTNMPQIEQLGAGTTFKEVSRNTMAQYSMLYVNDRCLYKTWSDKIKPIFNMQASLEKEINHLTHLRDSLLPMLMNGQVTIE